MAETINVTGAEAAADKVAGLLAGALNAGIAQNGAAVLAVSGGRSPILAFQKLAASGLDWSKVWVTLVDERWVDPSSDDSNEKLVRTNLLQGSAQAARFVPMKTADATADGGYPAVELAFSALPRPIDAVLLGMGEDGHFASLFPGNPALAEGLDPANPNLCLAVPAGEGRAPPQPRMSLTLAAILAARTLVLLTGGETKRAVLDRAMKGASSAELPIAALLSARPDLKIVHQDS